MKLKSSKYIFTLIFLMLLVIIGSNTKLLNSHKPSNVVEYGIRTTKGNIISTGKTIPPKLIEDGLILELSQDLQETRDYLVLFFIDYQQVFVESSSEIVKQIRVELDPLDTEKIPFKIDLPSGSKELSILIIKKPNYMVEQGDVERAMKAEDVLSLRYCIDLNSEKEYQLSKLEHDVIDGNQITRVFLSNERNELKICTTLASGEETYITLGNKKDTGVEYALIALKDWNQVPIENELVQYFFVDVNKYIIFKHILPKTKHEANYQLILFPYPFNVTEKDLSTTFTYTTHRIHILGDE